METKTCVLLLWIQTLTLVRCQDCTLEQFKQSSHFDSKFDTTALEAVYPAGKQVKVPCITGYAGFFKLICTEGNWRPMGAKCQPKSCGHPGEAQFAEFHLATGDDFVFGSKVVYTCNRGFQMVSRTNFRRCMADGWDGNVPVCEAQKCPVIHVSDKVQVVGDLEDATFGNVIRFSCKSRNQILDGASEVYCTDTGAWSGDAPDCIAITCETPEIEHGSVRDGPREYTENEILNFDCDDDYKRTDERSSRCMKVAGKGAWSPTPGCKLKTCDLELQMGPGTSYIPSNKNMFLPGSTLQVRCGENYWIVDTQTTSADVTCQRNGEWDITPICREVTCSLPQDNAVDYWNAWRQSKLGQTVQYSCRRGFEKPRGTSSATCTRTGWDPKPLCAKTFCEKPDLEHATITFNDRNIYPNGDYFHYSCINGDRTFTLTCELGTWTGFVSCSVRRSCVKPIIENGFTIGPIDETVYYSCNEGFKLFTKAWWGVAKCVNGEWSDLTTCIDNRQCGKAPELPKGKAVPENAGHSQRLRIDCDEGFEAAIPALICANGEWDSSQVSLDNICFPIMDLCSPPPKVNNAIITTPYKRKYLPGSAVTYQCRDTYIMEGEATIRCTAREWEETTISCNAHCENLLDEKLTVTLPVDKETYKNGEVIEYSCKEPDPGEEGSATCVDGKWNKTVECPGLSCTVGELHPSLSVTGFSPVNGKVQSGEKLQFQCRDPYVLDGSKEAECSETGEWNSPLPTCSEICKIPKLPQELRISSAHTGNELMKGQTVTLACTRSGHFIRGNATIECLANGELSGPFPTCGGPAGCQNPPPLEDGDTRGATKSEYYHNESVEYMCPRYYKMEGTGRRTCKNGEWTGEIKCLKPCTVNRSHMDERNIRFAHVRDDKLYSEHDDVIGFACKRGRRVGSVGLRQKCIDGVMELPTCG